MIPPLLCRILCGLALCMPLWLTAQKLPTDDPPDPYQYVTAFARYHSLLLQQLEPVNRQLASGQEIALHIKDWERLDLPGRWQALTRQRALITFPLPVAQERNLAILEEQGSAMLDMLLPLLNDQDSAHWRRGLKEVEDHQLAIQAAYGGLRTYVMEEQAPPPPDLDLFESFLSTVEAIQLALREDEDEMIARDYHALRSLQKQITGNKDTFLTTWPRYPASRRDPAIHLQTWLRQADKWLDHLEDYLAGEALPAPFSAYKKSYGYLQYRLLPLYNGQGQGLLDSYLQLRQRVKGTARNWPPVLPDFERITPREAVMLVRGVPSRYVLILDVSASMGNGYKWRQVMGQLDRWTLGLHPEDRVSILACGKEIETWEAAQSPDVIRGNIESWRSHPLEGGSNIAQALALALSLAENPWAHTERTKVLLITDGGFEIPFSALATLQRYQDSGARLFTTYTGRQEPRMREHLIRLAEMGGGNYWFLNTRGLFPLSHPEPSAGLSRN